MMYSCLDLEDRIAEARNSGADAVEFRKWTNKDIDKITASKMPVSVFNIDSKDEALSYDLSRGILNDGRSEDFIKALKESIPIYKKLKASGMIVLIGEGREPCCENVKKCLTDARELLEAENVTVAVECLNSIDRKGYSMPYVSPVLDIIRSVNSPNIKLLYDIYHQHMMKDFDIREIQDNIGYIGHFHVADCPGRHQPGTGNINYATILSEINKTNYSGYIGLEYRATVTDTETFDFLCEVKKNV